MKKMGLMFFFAFLSACGLNPETEGMIESFSMNSSDLNQNYRIYVYTPAGYESSSLLYPTLYVLDGDDAYRIVSRNISAKVSQGEMEPCIMVAIGYAGDVNHRMRDYTPTVQAGNTAETAGQVSAFFQFVTNEVIPRIESDYRVLPGNTNRALMGHSLGGLATMFALFQHNETFGSFVASSPSLMWDYQVMFSYETNYAEGNFDLPATLYMAIGSEENFGYTAAFSAMENVLTNRGYPNFSLTTEIHARQNHADSFRINMDTGLDYLFQ